MERLVRNNKYFRGKTGCTSEDLKQLIQEELKKNSKVADYEEISTEVQTMFTIWISKTSPSFCFVTLNLKPFDGRSYLREHIHGELQVAQNMAQYMRKQRKIEQENERLSSHAANLECKMSKASLSFKNLDEAQQQASELKKKRENDLKVTSKRSELKGKAEKVEAEKRKAEEKEMELMT